MDMESVMDFNAFDSSSLNETSNEQTFDLAALNEPVLVASGKSEKDAEIYFRYDPNNFSPMFMYRTSNDIVASSIIHSSSEGLGRYEIGRKLGINSRFKRGNRKVSSHIQQVVKGLPDNFGQYQKQEGKYRMYKYFYKANQPKNVDQLLKKFKVVAGVDCPYKLEDIVKFPDMNLNTLRISDVTLKRFTYILELLNEEEVVITISKMVKHIQKREKENGYNFEADKKSILKCLLALNKKNLCNLLETEIQAEDVLKKNFEVITLPYITTVDCPEVRKAINRSIEAFHADNKIFPTGQARAYTRHQTAEELKTEGFDASIIDFNQMSIDERHKLMKLIVFSGQTERSYVDAKKKTTNEPEIESNMAVINDTSIDQLAEILMEPGPSDTTFEYLLPPTEDTSISNEQPGPSSTSEKTNYYDPNVNYGFQSGKFVRCQVLHEFAWHFVYNKPKARPSGMLMPTYFDRFPPGYKLPFDGIQVEILEDPDEEVNLVYDTEEDSPFRYVPPLPSYRDSQEGWFMVKDLYPELDAYLSDPIQRHILVSDLPEKLRNELINKKIYPSIEQLCALLCGCGLMRSGKSFDQSKSASSSTSFFFVGKETYLYDTSSSQKGHAKVTPPIEQYNKYVYVFEKREDLHAYWNHLKGIAQATPLTSKNEKIENEEKELLSTKKYSIGTVDLKLHEISYDAKIGMVAPTPPNTGCAGFDPVLYVHLKRHWDADRTKYSEWFLTRARKYAEIVKPVIEGRVLNSNKVWQGLSTFMSSDGQFYKRKEIDPVLSTQALRALKMGVLKRKTTDSSTKSTKRRPSKATKQQEPYQEISYLEYFEPQLTGEQSPSTSSNTEVIQTLADALAHIDEEGNLIESPLKNSIKQESGIHQSHKKKRPLDEIDILSQQRALKIRSKFSPKEKDMLIMIRALGFFLNPVYRFWLDPAVVRDVMHEFVPESRTKTVGSLMAAAVRELGKPNRMSHLQYIVKTLSSYKQMRDIRNQLASRSFPKEGANEEKKRFFFSAFEVAHRLLFNEAHRLPSVTISDEMFDHYLQNANVSVSTKIITETLQIPYRSQKPTSLDHVQQCVAFNAIIMLFLSDTTANNEADEEMLLSKLIDHISAKALTEVLDRLRSDGLISKIKERNDEGQGYTGKATYSLYYRHFFNHRYRNDILKLTERAMERFKDGQELTKEDDAGIMLALSSFLYDDKKSLVLNTPDSIKDIFVDDEFLSKDTKQLRYLENMNIHLETVRVTPQINPEQNEELFNLDELLSTLVTKVPLTAIQNPLQLNSIYKLCESEEPQMVQAVYQEVLSSKIIGRSLDELEKAAHVDVTSKHAVSRILDVLVKNYVVFECGVDKRRYVLIENAKCWMMTTKEYGFFIRPWCMANGDVNPIIFRWMSEGILFQIHSKPGILLSDLEALYGFALQPVHLHEILVVLEKIRAIKILTKFFSNTKKRSPFETNKILQEMKYVVSEEGGVERYAQIFANVEMPEHLYMNVGRKLNG